MLALSVYQALKGAVASTSDDGRQVVLQSPATPEAVLNAVSALQVAADPCNA